ncbi:MAG TPA: hypothetical protein VKK31_31085 [Thermoanaerobaculia bacterium]|nr:hypothetical protein [Thermoanaerobaculia bacterium]
MRKLTLAGALLGLALTAQGCGGGGSSSPTEPGGRPIRGNWIGTISGTHADLRVQGTCDLEMDLDPTFNGRWWIDCPNGASSQGQALGISISNIVAFVFLTGSPRSDCPWSGVASGTAGTIEGEFEVTDCATNAQRSTGTFQLRRR